jgi:hypothetical protein
MKRLTPQEKKRLSYERDRRNDYGENDKASRKAIPLQKRKVLRAYRKLTRQRLPKNELVADLEGAEAAEFRVREVKRKNWRKVPDIPLGQFIEQQTDARGRRYGRKLWAMARRSSE